jgi:hypothetical protein
MAIQEIPSPLTVSEPLASIFCRRSFKPTINPALRSVSSVFRKSSPSSELVRMLSACCAIVWNRQHDEIAAAMSDGTIADFLFQ